MSMLLIIRMALLVICLPAIVSAQVGIGTSNPAASAQLDVTSTNKGFLPPRMTSTQRGQISSPTAGLVVYQTDGTVGLYYYNGSAWIYLSGTVASTPQAGFTCGTSTVTFTYRGSNVTYGTVAGANGRCWLDRNLGATQVATGYNDGNSYGDYFQWGRGDDGHQLSNSSTTSVLSISSSPGNALFITNSGGNYDWKNFRSDLLWQSLTGTNNVCPSGWHVPTEAEWLIEREASMGTNSSTGTFYSSAVLKLPAAGIRTNTGGAPANPGSHSHYWTSTVDGSNVVAMWFSSGSTQTRDTRGRANAMPVRCIKD